MIGRKIITDVLTPDKRICTGTTVDYNPLSIQCRAAHSPGQQQVLQMFQGFRLNSSGNLINDHS